MPESRPFQRIGVAGAGAMGRGIAQLFAQTGYPIVLFDVQPGAAQAAVDGLRKTFSMLADKGRLSAAQAQAAADAITIADGVAGFASCDLVIEAIIERLDVKRAFFAELEQVVPAETVIASNTSSLSITALAAETRHPARIAGYHFFNPVPLMKLVEVISGPRTAPRTIERLVALAREAGHTPVEAQDTPGFIVNHAGRGFGTESFKLLGERVADTADIDRVMREQVEFGGRGFRLGPFELMDLTGLDVSHFVMESIFDQYYQDPRYRPSVIGAQRVAARLYGRKAKEGFYRYDADAGNAPAASLLPEAPIPTVTDLPRVWISRERHHEALSELFTQAGAAIDEAAKPAADSLIVTAPLGLDASTTAARAGLDGSRTVAIDTLFPFAHRACKRRTLMLTPATAPSYRDAAHALLARDSAKVTVIQDSAGFIAQRMVAIIVAIGGEIAQQGVARPADIDTAVQLGLGYPMGPLAMGDALGPARVCELMANMYQVNGDPRYRPSLWLQRRAQLGLSLLHP